MPDIVVISHANCNDGFAANDTVTTPLSRECTKCNAEKPLEDFRFRVNGRFGRDSVCRDCDRIRDAVWQKNIRTRQRQKRIVERINELKKIPAIDLAYIAGIVDGEGSIGITRTSRRCSSIGVYYTSRVSVANTSVELMEYLKSITKIGSVRPKTPSKLAKKPCFQWTLSPRGAGDLAEAILPYLVIKRRQTELVCDLQRIKMGRYGNTLPDEIVELQKSLYQQAAALNRKGVPIDQAT